MSFGGLVYYAEKFTSWNLTSKDSKPKYIPKEEIHTANGPPCVGSCSIERCKMIWCNAHPLRYKD